MSCAQTDTPVPSEGVETFTHEFMMGGKSQTFTVDYLQKVARVGDASIHLTAKEYDFLKFLVQHAGQVCTKREILNHLYGGLDEPELKIIDVFACKIRKKLSAHTGGANFIGTAWGRGYYFDELKSVTHDDPTGPRVRMIPGPDGKQISVANLPPPGTVRWVISRKVTVVCAIKGGLLSLEGALMRYPGLTGDEVNDWKATYSRHGSSGLRATRIQQYR